jgi:large subunit ribosomal protein L4
MKYEIRNFDNKAVGEILLNAEIFSAPLRQDILARMVHWQLAKRRAGTHSTKGISQISGTTKKPWRQKGTGRARQGSLRSPQFRGGAVIFGPLPRDRYKLLKDSSACLEATLSSKVASGELLIVDSLNAGTHKTKELSKI